MLAFLLFTIVFKCKELAARLQTNRAESVPRDGFRGSLGLCQGLCQGLLRELARTPIVVACRLAPDGLQPLPLGISRAPAAASHCRLLASMAGSTGV
jgi:hypothetical protein